MTLAYEEFIDFLASGTTPKGVVEFHPSEAAKARVAELIQRQKNGSSSADENAELKQFLQIEHVMRLAKARARERLSAS